MRWRNFRRWVLPAPERAVYRFISYNRRPWWAIGG